MMADDIQVATGPRLMPPKIVVHGVEGIGKTYFAHRSPKPIFLPTEDGQGKLDFARLVLGGNETIQSWPDLLRCCEWLYDEEHDYETVVIDSIDRAEELLHAHICREHGKSSIEDWGWAKGYGLAFTEFLSLTRRLDALHEHRRMAVIVICHSAVRTHYPPDAPSFDRYELRLHKHIAGHLTGWSGAVLFASPRLHVVHDKEKFGNERSRGVGYGERVLYTEARPSHVAKNHYDLPAELPFEKASSWSVFEAAFLEDRSNTNNNNTVAQVATTTATEVAADG